LPVPNSAPDSLTPKNLNLVRDPEQRLLPELGAVEVGVEVVPGFVVVEEAVVDAVPGRHCE
jgi:hypothetical protein